jgi:hypothetical protein
VSRDVARARECPPVPKCTRLVPATRSGIVGAGNIICPYAGLLCKPSDGLEPSTPSLPSRDHSRHSFPCKSGRDEPTRMRRDASRGSFQMCPLCVRHLLTCSTTDSSNGPCCYPSRRLPSPGARDEHAPVSSTIRANGGLVRAEFSRHRELSRPRRAPTSGAVLDVDAQLAQVDDGGSTPPDRVGGERQHEGHPVGSPERLAVAQDAVMARRRLDAQATGLEPAG